LNPGSRIRYLFFSLSYHQTAPPPCSCLVGVGQAAHARHDAEHVVVDGVDAHLGRALLLDRVDGQREVERGLVDTREVARAAGLVLLGLEREGVHVDAHRRRAGVVLPRLHLVEVAALALVEAVLAVELHLGDLHGVLALALDVRGQDDLGEQVVRGALEEVVRTGRAVRLVDARARGEARANRNTDAAQLGLGVGEARDTENVGTACVPLTELVAKAPRPSTAVTMPSVDQSSE